MKRLIKLATVSSLLVCMAVPVMAADVSTEEPTQHLATVTMVADETGEMTVDSVNGVEPAAGLNQYPVSGNINTSGYTNIGNQLSPSLLWDTVFVTSNGSNPGNAEIKLVDSTTGSTKAGPVLVAPGQEDIKVGWVPSNGKYYASARATSTPGYYTFYLDSNTLG